MIGAWRLDNVKLHSMFCEWAGWVRSKRLYSPSPNPQSIIGTLVRLPSGREGNARLDPQLAALHSAIIGAEEADRILIVCYYLRAQSHRKYRRGGVPVKTMAHALGVSRKTFYARLLDTRRRIWQRVEKHEQQGDKLMLAVG